MHAQMLCRLLHNVFDCFSSPPASQKRAAQGTPASGLLHAAAAQVGYQITLVKFFLFFGVTFLLLLISETLGILCAGLHRNELVGMIILATFYVPLLMFTGFIQARRTSARGILPHALHA